MNPPPPSESVEHDEAFAILDGGDVGIVVFGLNESLGSCNATAQRLLEISDGGVTRELLNLLPWCSCEILGTCEGEPPYPWSDGFEDEAAAVNRMMCLLRPDGSKTVLNVRAKTWVTAVESETLLAVYFRDITAQQQLADSLRMNSKLLEASQAIARVGGWELDLETNDLFWTDETYRILETSPAEHTPTVESGVNDFLPESRTKISQALEVAMTKGVGYDLELETFTAKGRRIHVRASCEVTCREGKPVKLTGTFQDITAAKQAEASLLEVGHFAQDTLDSLDASICVLDETGTIIAVNRIWTDFSGDTTRGEVDLGVNYLEVCDAVGGADAVFAGRTAAGIRSLLGGGKRVFYTEYPCHSPEKRRWFALRASRFRPGEKRCVVVAHADITQRREAELKLRDSHAELQELAKRLQAAKETESRRIARVVHDELGQQLTGLKMDLRAIKKLLEKAEPDATRKALHRTGEATQLIDETARTVQMIASALRPAILDQLGLWAALREEARVFGKRSFLKLNLEIPEDEPVLSEERATACYRIVQEALTNVVRHAEASEVEVVLTVLDSRLIMTIEDNGKGIELNRLGHHQSIGLLGMRERARQLGGELAIMRRPEGGTIVRAEIDMPPPADSEDSP